MRYYIIFGITLILLFAIIFFDPYKKYLGVYDSDINIELVNEDDNYVWIYDKNNENLEIENFSMNSWNISSLKDGNTNIDFYYLNESTNDIKYKIHYEFKIKNKKIYWTTGYAKGLMDFPNPY